jgi:hypothetical protein
MFFPNKNDFFISENELATLTFRQVLESRVFIIDSFERGFVKINISIDYMKKHISSISTENNNFFK